MQARFAVVSVLSLLLASPSQALLPAATALSRAGSRGSGMTRTTSTTVASSTTTVDEGDGGGEEVVDASQQLVYPDGSSTPCVIKVVGVGGGGGNAVNRMVDTRIRGVDFWSINTDAQALARANSHKTLTIGTRVTRGLGSGGDPEVGRAAAVESREQIESCVTGSDLVFITAGMGGGTGSGAAPIVAEAAKARGALTVGVVTKPFRFEGKRRMSQATDAIGRLQEQVDTLIVVSNDKLLQIVPENTPLSEAFLVADDILRQGVVGISEIIIKPGLINVDFADVRTIMQSAGTALMGIGTGRGATRARDAAVAAISSPLLDIPIKRAKGIIFNVVGGVDISLQEINEAAKVIYENVDQDANIIFGALVDEKMGDECSITVLATGFDLSIGDLVVDSPEDGGVRDQYAGASGGIGGIGGRIGARADAFEPRKKRWWQRW